jgi:hypothetical protein
VITTAFGIGLGALGGRAREKQERKEGVRSATPVAQSSETPLSASTASSTPPSS